MDDLSSSGSPIDPDADEATQRQLHLARAQGDAYGAAVEHLATCGALAGAEQRAGDYWVGFAVAAAEGVYEWADGELVWREPSNGDLHVEITVRDASDGRFVPSARVIVTLIGPDGDRLGTHEQPLLWHPMVYHYGRNWSAPSDGSYGLRVRVEPPRFLRHDQVNGNRLVDPVEIEFRDVRIHHG